IRYVASISYNGSKFYGFQRLKDHKTVQEEIEKALTKINKSLILVKGAGRTDRGVHAFNQKIHFDLNIDINEEHLKWAMNSLLKPNIYVNDVKEVNSDFHARFDVKYKIYDYVINLGEYDVIDNDYLYNFGFPLDLKDMRKAAKYMLGFHSYKAFTCGTRENYNSIIYKIKLKKKKDILVITFNGKTFYSYMVRNLVGALILVGQGRAKPESINEMLESGLNSYGYLTVPACGLYLVDVVY